MPHKNIILLLIILPLFFINKTTFSQNESIACNDSIVIPYEEINTKTRYGVSYVIRNYEEYQYAQNVRKPFPEIDFKKYTLIIVYIGTSGCKKPNASHQILKKGNRYYVKTTIIEHGYYRGFTHVMFKCLIPKIEENSEVEFEVHKTNSVKSTFPFGPTKKKKQK